MAENARIDDLRRRVQKDPASIAFAQLAEEYRRAGQFAESVDVCRAGLAIHPTYLSARVTLGRALIELGQLEDARAELGNVLKSAPENLAAIRGVAEICHKQGSPSDALRYYKAALAIARNDPELEQMVSDLSRQVSPQTRPDVENSLSLEDMRHELKALVAVPPAPPPVEPPVAVPASTAVEPPAKVDPPAAVAPAAKFEQPASVESSVPIESASVERPALFASPEPFAMPAPALAPPSATATVFASAEPMLASPELAAVPPPPVTIDPALARAHGSLPGAAASSRGPPRRDRVTRRPPDAGLCDLGVPP